MRLDKFLSDSTPYSRKEIKLMVKKGEVLLNGSKPSSADVKINETLDEVLVKGEKVGYKKFIYLMMNKPSGYVSATEDKHYPTVIDLLPEEYKHFEPFCVGRLDIDTEGLLLLTNDGEWAHKMMSPKSEVYKKYYARLDAPMQETDKEVFSHGIAFREYTTKPAILEICDNPDEVYISICEGKFHQVKKMCEYVGKNVVYLKRLSIGDIVLDERLKLGEVKEIER